MLISWIKNYNNIWFNNFVKLESNIPGKNVDEVEDDNDDDKAKKYTLHKWILALKTLC